MLHFQKYYQEQVMKHANAEKEAGKAIWPTQAANLTKSLDAEIKFCEGLACDSTGSSKLAW